MSMANQRGLTDRQHAARSGKLTASRVAPLMTGDKQRITNLWRELTGDPDYVPVNLSGVWPVQLGSHTESLNLEWFARKHGPISRVGELCEHPTVDWAAATLDAWSIDHQCPVEAKHTAGREPLEVIIERYQPQMHWQGLVTGARRVALSIIMGANEPIVEFIELDRGYFVELWHRAVKFMECVRTRTPPVELEPISAPVPAVAVYDMTGNNEWADSAHIWRETTDERARYEAAEKRLKSMVPTDAKICHGHGVRITRDRAGRLSLRGLAGEHH